MLLVVRYVLQRGGGKIARFLAGCTALSCPGPGSSRSSGSRRSSGPREPPSSIQRFNLQVTGPFAISRPSGSRTSTSATVIVRPRRTTRPQAIRSQDRAPSR